MAGFKSTMLFDVLANILVGKNFDTYCKHINSEHFHEAAKFMILKYLTMSQSEGVRNVVIDNYTTLERMPERALYKWLLL